MGDHSAISWTDASWNPIRSAVEGGMVRWGCEKVSPGCDHCYASALHQRHGGAEYPTEERRTHSWDPGDIRAGSEHLQLHEPTLSQPLRWAKPRMIFVCSMTDLFGDWVPDEWIADVFTQMQCAPQHTFQVLTKRAKRMRDYLRGRKWLTPDTDGFVDALPNVWLGVSVESQEYAWRLNYLCETPAAVRFVSAEPLLGPLDLTKWLVPEGHFCRTEHAPQSPETELALMDIYRAAGRQLGGAYLDWLIDGGESGPGFRPADPDWFRALRDQCQATGVAYFHKQNSGLRPGKGTLLDGLEWHEFPQVTA